VEILVVLAIPYKISEDDYKRYLDLASKYGAYCWRGYDASPLHRMAAVVKNWQNIGLSALPEYVIRITHDDILIDAETLLYLLEGVIMADAGYGITPTIIEGAGVEVISTENLLWAAQHHKDNIEDVSYFVKGRGVPKSDIVKLIPRSQIQRPYRLTLDYYEDYVVLENVFREVGVDASLDKICEYLDLNQSILDYNKAPEITLYTCVRNGARWIRHTIEAIKSCTDKEYIVVDDASTDSTLHQLLKYYGREKIKILVNNENKGLASSSNIALNHARGKYIMRIDADDILMVNSLNKMKAKIEETGAVICYANYNEIDEKGNIIRKNVSAREKHHIGCALINKRFLNELRFKEGLRHWDGLELYNRIKNNFPIAYIDEPLWYYRVHKDSLSNSDLQERDRIRKQIEGKQDGE